MNPSSSHHSRSDESSGSITGDTSLRVTERLRRRRTSLLICLALTAVTAVIYAPVLFHDFIEFDDVRYVTNKPMVQQGLTLPGVLWAFVNFEASNWHPVTWLSHMLDCTVFQLFPGGHHLTNVALHALNALLLFLLLQRMTGAAWRSALVAALFAWHPLHVESVAWVAERKDMLSTLFLILTIWAYVRYTEKPGWPRYAWVLIWYALGLMSKPMIVTLPLLLLLLDFWPLDRMREPPKTTPVMLAPFMAILEARVLPLVRILRWQRSHESGSEGSNARTSGCGSSTAAPCCRWEAALQRRFGEKYGLAVEKFPLFALSALSCAVTLLAQSNGETSQSLDAVPMSMRLANACVAYGTYLWKMFFPAELAVIYPLPADLHWGWLIVSVLALALITLVVARGGKKHPHSIVGWLWYLVALLPVIGLVQVGNTALADRYTYIPLIGVFILVVWTVADWLPGGSRSRPAHLLIAAAVLLACTWGTGRQLQYWRDGYQLFERALAVTENNYIAHNNLGALLARQKRYAEAKDHFVSAVNERPDSPAARLNLAQALEHLGDFTAAINEYRVALHLRPEWPEAQAALARVLAYSTDP